MRVLITGNRNKDVCKPLVQLLESKGHQCNCLSRETGFDFSSDPYGVMKKVVSETEEAEVFINLYANYFFNQTLLAHQVFKNWCEKDLNERWLINVGSTTDRVKRGKANLYHYEKLALRDLSNGLSLNGVWGETPRVSHISFGTLSNRERQNPGRKTIPLEKAAEYIVWILEQPKALHINEISIDPMQRDLAL